MTQTSFIAMRRNPWAVLNFQYVDLRFFSFNSNTDVSHIKLFFTLFVELKQWKNKTRMFGHSCHVCRHFTENKHYLEHY